MAKVWREIAAPKKHRDFMNTFESSGIPVNQSRSNLIEKWVYFVSFGRFNLQFSSIEQVDECREFFSKKIHKSTRGHHPPGEHYWQAWYCRLPKGLKKSANRLKFIKLLNQIISKWG